MGLGELVLGLLERALQIRARHVARRLCGLQRTLAFPQLSANE
jgi:hypothetical protein